MITQHYHQSETDQNFKPTWDVSSQLFVGNRLKPFRDIFRDIWPRIRYIEVLAYIGFQIQILANGNIRHDL